MTEGRGERLLDLLAAALEIEPAERDEWLAGACKGDDGLRAGVLTLLAREAEAAELFGEAAESRKVEAAEGSAQGDLVGSDPLTPGGRLGDYAIEERIGAGGMGVVYRARQLSLNRIVALKVLPHQLRSSARRLERFRREVEAAARLHHPNIVTVFASGDDGSTAFYAMEYVNGPSLSRVIEVLRRVPNPAVRDSRFDADQVVSDPGPSSSCSPCALLPGGDAEGSLNVNEYFDRVAKLLAGVAEGLHFAHENDVVHRDIKPSNLWFSGDGRLRIGDFGLARLAKEPSVTQSGEVIGTPYYMAPEQLDGRNSGVDPRTDVYAMGATLYEALTLQPPFPGTSREVVLSRISTEEARPPRKINRAVPRDLETICMKALEKHPRDRYPNAAEMAEDLRRFNSRLPVSARRSGHLHRGLRWCSRHPTLACAVSASVVLAGIAAAMAVRAQYLSTEASRAAQVSSELEAAEAEIAVANESEQQRLFQRAMLAGMQGDFQAVSEAISEAAQREASPARLSMARGQVHLFGGDFDKAIEEFESARYELPDRLATYALLAESYARAGLYSTARSMRSKAQQLTADSVEELILLGRMELQFEPAVARSALNEAIERDRRNIVARLIRGAASAQIAYLTGDPQEAEKAIADLQLAEPFLDETPYLLGQFVNAHLIASSAYAMRSNAASASRHLEDAGNFARRLGDYPGEYEAHRWRAYYFERTGDLASAIDDWRAIEDKTIGYLIMCLYRAGRFEEALHACEAYRAHTKTGTADFCHSFVLAAVLGDAETLSNDFSFEQQLEWDTSAAWIGLHTLWGLAGDPARAAAEIRACDLPSESKDSTQVMYGYLSGSLPAADYLDSASTDRRDLSQAHFLIGMSQLAVGERANARDSFGSAIDLGLHFDFSNALSCALLAQLDRAPSWPRWIPDRKADP